MGRRDGRHRQPVPGTREDRERQQPRRDRREPRCLYPLQPVCASLPRGAGERRHRHGASRQRVEDRVRLRRPDGGFDLRGLRRMRAGLSDRRADGGEPARRDRCAAAIPRSPRRYPVPLLRRRLPDPGARQGRPDSLRRRPRRSGERTAAVRQRPLRFRLHHSPAAADEADDPPRRRAERWRREARPREPVDAFPRGELGGSTGLCSRRSAKGTRCLRAVGTGRLRFRERLERGSLPLPEAGPNRLRHQQRRSLHAAVSCVLGRGADGGYRLGRRHRAVHGGG